MKTIVAAYHDVGSEGLSALLRNGFEVQAVFTYRDSPDESIWFSSVARLAAESNIPVYTPDDINHPIWVMKIRELEPDVVFSFYYRHLLGQPILDIPKAGCINLHGSLLPKLRGRAPINWALVNGENRTGATLHYMTAQADAGDIIAQESFPITDDDTALSVHGKLVGVIGPMLDEYLPRISNGTAPRTPQNPAEATYVGKRSPEDGLIDWTQTNAVIRNLIRAVAHPFPGAFTFHRQTRVRIWTAQLRAAERDTDAVPGTVLSVEPLVVACGHGALEVALAQSDDGVPMCGEQLSETLGIVTGTRLGERAIRPRGRRKTNVLILGANGFIGNALTERLLCEDTYVVHGLDIKSDAIERFLDEPNFHFHEGDIAIHDEWVEYHIKKCDIVLPLIAIATPIEYTRNPLKVFELDFEQNLRVIRDCVKYKKRVVFPSTSEVYGMCDEPEFDEDRSNLVVGPINKQRWIYSSIKQLLDRLIWAYGKCDGLQFTLFRPFNWIGPRLDSLDSARIGSSRAITQLILNLVEGTPIQLIDGGEQKRCFTDVTEGIECLFRIIQNKDKVCDGQIINIGNPANESSIRELAEYLVEQFESHPLRGQFPPFAGMRNLESHAYYGEGYEDVRHRRPRIENARRLLGWEPVIPTRDAVRRTLDFFLREFLASNNPEHEISGTGSRPAIGRARPKASTNE